MRYVMLPLVLIAAGCAPTPKELAQSQARDASAQEKLARTLSGLVPGEAVSCLPTLPQTHTEGYGRTILYRVSNSLIYRTETGGGCETIGRDVLVTRSPSGRLCSGDIAQTFDPVSRFPTGSCSFGEFVPYRKP